MAFILSPDIRIRSALPEDCSLLSQLGKKAYRQHFTYLWTPEGLEAFFDFAYTPEYFRAVLQDDNAIIWLLEHESQAVGYLMYYRRKRLPGQETAGGYVNRIYLLESCLGKGLGGQLLNRAFEQAQRDRCPYIWLESMQSSAESIRFYQKFGFEICGETAYTAVAMRSPELSKMWYLMKVVVQELND